MFLKAKIYSNTGNKKSENKFELMKKGPIYAIISSWQHYGNTKSEG